MTPIILSKDPTWDVHFCRPCGKNKPCQHHHEGRYYCEHHAKQMIDKGIANLEKKPRNEPTLIKRCEVCQKDFQYSGYRVKRTCSEACKSKLLSKKSSVAKPHRGKYPKTLFCVVCGKPFEIQTNNALRKQTCSPSCKRALMSIKTLQNNERRKQEEVEHQLPNPTYLHR